MKVTQEKLPASQLGLEIEIPPEKSKQAYEKTLQDYTRNINLSGFRKGKVPRQVLIQRIGVGRIKAAVVEELIQESLKQAVEQEKIQAIGQFELRSSFDDLVANFEPGAALTFSAVVDVPPEVKLNQYQDLQVQAEEVKYDPDRVDNVLEDYRKRTATLVPVEGRPAQEGDVATVDFTGRLVEVPEGQESVEIPGGSATDFELELTEGRFIPGFVDGVIGLNAGETKEVEATFPESYPQEELAGKAAVFTITVKELKERELPELDDDFAQEVSEFETLAELRASLESRFQKEAEQKTKTNKQEAILNELVKHVEVELPESVVRQEVDQSITQTAMQLSQQGLDIRKTFTKDIVNMLREQARPEAIKRLQRTLALREVGKLESLEVEPEAIEAKVSEILADYQGQDVDPDRLREAVEDDLLRDKILDWLEEHGTVELVPEGSLQPDESEEEATEEATIDEVAEDLEPAVSTAPAADEAETTEESSEASAAPANVTSDVPDDVIDVAATPIEDPEAEAPAAETSETETAETEKKSKSTKAKSSGEKTENSAKKASKSSKSAKSDKSESK
jgi:trigger factor